MRSDELVALIRGVRFNPVRIREGYDMGEVDQFLDELEQEARRGGDLGALVVTAAFGHVKWREGYEIADVDEFLQRLGGVAVTSTAVADPAPSGSTAWAVRALVDRVRFTPVRLHESYDMGDVDRLLDEIVATAERGEPVAPVIDRAHFGLGRLREGYDMGEVDRFLVQLKGTGPVVTDPGVIQEQRGLLGRLLGRR